VEVICFENHDYQWLAKKKWGYGLFIISTGEVFVKEGSLILHGLPHQHMNLFLSE